MVITLQHQFIGVCMVGSFHGDQPWAKDMPLGSDRIHEGWLKNRLVRVKDGVIIPPNWTRIQGAKELADLVEWM